MLEHGVASQHLAPPSEIETFLPAAPAVSSAKMGWSGLYVDVCDKHPPADVDLPACTHHLVLMNLKPLDRLIEELDGRVHEVKVPERGLILVPAKVPTRWRWDGPTAVIILYLAPEMIAKALPKPATFDAQRFASGDNPVFHDPLIEQMALALKAELESGGLGGRVYGESLGSALAAHLLRHYSLPGPALDEYRERLSRYRVRQVAEYVEENLGSDLSLAELAGVAHLSLYHFARAFRQATGLAPHQYVLTRRVERAKQMLTQRRLRIAEISHDLGFGDQSQFTRVFRKIVGITPGQYLACREG